jgi:hypothetical protein
MQIISLKYLKINVCLKIKVWHNHVSFYKMIFRPKIMTRPKKSLQVRFVQYLEIAVREDTNRGGGKSYLFLLKKYSIFYCIY